MESRHIISYVLFALAVVLIVLGFLGTAGFNALTGILLGLATIVVGVVFYRRGK